MDGDGPWVLVVEDDPEMRDEILLPSLQDAGFRATGAASAIDAYRCMLSRDYSVFILDVGLPDEDGFTLARNLRAFGNAGIIMLTGRHRSVSDQARGLDEGADAYVTKPVDLKLLAAIVRSLVRRIEPTKIARLRNHRVGWHVDLESWSLLTPNGARVRITHSERLLLDILAATPGESVPRERIIAHLTRSIHDFDPHRLEMLVHRLRRKVLAECGEKLSLIAVRGIGYVLIQS